MKYALIIGNNNYNDPKLAQLKTPAADAQALAAVLADKTIGSFDEVSPLINRTETEARRAISSFLTNKKPDDLVLVYFSGHGVLDDRGRLFLSLKDTETSLLKATAIPSTFISDEMDSCRSRRQVLILDCCHSGAFARGTKGEQKAVTEATFEGSGYGRVVMTASDSTQYALEGDQVISQTDLSLFTHFLLQGLKTGDADMDGDGHISLDEWYDYTYAKVISETPRQIPHRWSYNQQGDLVIARNPNARKKVAELPLELLQAVESPFTSIRESALNELGKLLRSRDPETAELARLSLEKMKEDDSRRISLAAENLLSEFEKARKPVDEEKVAVSKPGVETEPEALTVANEIPMAPPLPVTATSSAPERSPQPDIERRDNSADTQAVLPPLVFNQAFWVKWIGTALPAVTLSLIFFYYNKSMDGAGTATPVALFTLVAGLSSSIQWLVFKNRLRWWVAGNLAAGILLGFLHNYLYDHSESWWDIHLGLLLAYWVVGNFFLGLVLLKAQDKAENLAAIMRIGARRNVSFMLLTVSIGLSVLANITLVLYLYDQIRIALPMYGVAAILAGISLILNREIPKNIGFVTLAVFLLFDSINCILIILNPDYPPYYFAVNAVTALVSGLYFAFHRQTWRNFGFSMLTGYLVMTAAAGFTTYVNEQSYIFLSIASLFAVPAVAAFLWRK
jgi:uncharacterized caspase-like protein